MVYQLKAILRATGDFFNSCPGIELSLPSNMRTLISSFGRRIKISMQFPMVLLIKGFWIIDLWIGMSDKIGGSSTCKSSCFFFICFFYRLNQWCGL